MKKDWYVGRISDIFSSMGLTVLRGNVDYQSEKPDIVAIYDKLNKVYAFEVLPDDFFNDDVKGKSAVGSHDVRFYDYLREDILNDITKGLQNLDMLTLDGFNLDDKIIYAGIITSERYAKQVDRMLDYADIEHKGLDIVDELHLQLLSNEATERMRKQPLGIALKQ